MQENKQQIKKKHSSLVKMAENLPNMSSPHNPNFFLDYSDTKIDGKKCD